MRVITASPFRRQTRFGKRRSCSRIGRRHGWMPIAICAIEMCESTFDAVYGSPLLQALVGLKATDAGSRLPGKDPVHLALVAQRINELKAAIPEGGPREAAIRALLYLHQPDGVFDERGFNLLRRMREEAGSGMSLGEFKRVVREQFFMLLVDEQRAVEAIPAMLAKEPALAARMRATLRQPDRDGRSAQRRGTIALGRTGGPNRGRFQRSPRASAFRQAPSAATPCWQDVKARWSVAVARLEIGE